MNVEPWGTTGTGASGPVVVGIQYLLRARGHSLPIGGGYGPATEAAVRALQTAAGLTADGVVGPRTWPHLYVSTHSGSSGDAVRAVQQFGLVRSPGDSALVVDGSFGAMTEERVRFFQESWGLTQDGIAGSETWSFLSTLQPGPRPWPLVKVGATQATNWRVLAAQHLLRLHGSTIAADGAFGPLSGQAIHAFQQSHRSTDLSTTVGQLDWPLLIATVQRNDTGEAVRAAQTLLPGSLVVDGNFGSATDAATRQFQAMFAPPADGVIGPQTWFALTQRIFD
jgi:peptidoglycan hydrolase-like protein with peptidoglycan-binding domain